MNKQANRDLIKLLSNPDSVLAIVRSAIREEIELHRIEGRPVAVLRDGKPVFMMVEELEGEKKMLENSKHEAGNPNGVALDSDVELKQPIPVSA